MRNQRISDDGYRLVFHHNALSLFKTNSLNVQEIFYKKSGHLKLVLESQNLLKQRMGYKNIRTAIKTQTKRTYLCVISHFKKKIDVYPVDALYKFENVFSIVEKEAQKLTMKMVSKEELEHRRKSINYRIKKLEMEEEIHLKYEKDFDIYKLKDEIPLKNHEIAEAPLKNTQKQSIEERLCLAIYRAQVVNFSILLEIYKNQAIIENVLRRMCININGRFVLQNCFFDPDLQKLRGYILNIFNNHEFIDIKNIPSQNSDFMYLLNEISVFKDGKFYLKGRREDFILKEPNLDLLKILKEMPFCSLDELGKITGLEKENLKARIDDLKPSDGKVHILLNNLIAFDFLDSKIRSASLEFFKKHSKFKRGEIFKYVYDNLKIEMTHIDFSKIVKEFCDRKGDSWVLKS